MSKPFVLSKSRYIRGMQCEKAMYLDTYRSELAEVSGDTLQAFAAGRSFEKSYKETFAGAIDVSRQAGRRFGDYPRLTRELLRGTGSTTLLEAGFAYHGVLVLADVLHRTAAGEITLYEVKNSSRAKEVFRQDLFLQYYVVSHALTVPVSSFCLVLRPDGEPSPQEEQPRGEAREPFHLLDLTQEAHAAMPTVAARIARFSSVLQGLEPQVAVGEQCRLPYACPYQRYCQGRKNAQLELAAPANE